MAIREIQPQDNAKVAELVRSVLVEMGVPKVGTALADTALSDMYKTYDKHRAVYYVVEEGKKIVGCAGIAQLDNYEGNICELQKMYVSKETRGQGLSKKMMKKCLDAARAFGYEKCYLETMPYMKIAQKLYLQNGFEYIEEPLGDTGHHACPVRMLKTL